LINLIKLVEILIDHNLIPNNIVDSNYYIEKEEDRWIIKYETDKGIFLAFETEFGSLKLVIPLRLYEIETPLETLLDTLELNGALEGSLTKTTLGPVIMLSYEREIPPHRLTEAPVDICQIFKIIRKEIGFVEQFLYSSNEIDTDSGMETMVERLEKTIKDKDES
jgi:hypothetical protein